MALSIKNPQTERIAREVAAETGENITQAIYIALEERLERIRGRVKTPDMAADIMNISKRCSRLPDHDRRTPDEILGYDPTGVPQ